MDAATTYVACRVDSSSPKRPASDAVRWYKVGTNARRQPDLRLGSGSLFMPLDVALNFFVRVLTAVLVVVAREWRYLAIDYSTIA